MDATSTAKTKKAKQPVVVRTGNRTVAKFHENATNISGTVQDLQRSLKDIETGIKVDLEGKKSFENHIDELNRRKADLQARITSNQKWIDMFVNDIGPFQQKYAHLVDDIHGIYENAKVFHAKGIEMLIDEFNYHPAFKRWNDTFTAIPFKPK